MILPLDHVILLIFPSVHVILLKPFPVPLDVLQFRSGLVGSIQDGISAFQKAQMEPCGSQSRDTDLQPIIVTVTGSACSGWLGLVEPCYLRDTDLQPIGVTYRPLT